MHWWTRLAASVVVTLCAGPLPAQEQKLSWPQFRGPTGMGTSPDTIPLTWSQTENLAWKVELLGRGTSTPAILGDRLYLTYYTGSPQDLKRFILCLNRTDGKELWTKEVPSILPEQSSIRDDHGYASNSPVTDGKTLFTFFGKSGVFAHTLDGKQLWHADVGSGLNGWGSAASPILFENLVIVNASVESESLRALDKATGKERWRATGIKESWNTPILVKPASGPTELVVAIVGKILGFDPKTGKQLWSCNTDIGWYMVPCLVADKAGVIYCIGGRSGGGLAVRAGGRGDVTRSHRLWTITKGSNVCSPLYHDGHIYWTHENTGVAYCADCKTGKIVYEERLERANQFYASPVLAGDRIVHLDRGGRAFVLPAKPKFEVLATNELRERAPFNASMAVAGGNLFIRSDKTLYCIGKQ